MTVKDLYERDIYGRDASEQTDLSRGRFPAACPFQLDQILDAAYPPE